MIPVMQRIVASGWDGDVPGDCVKCCIASILERAYEDVPHFVAGEVKHEDGTRMDWHGGLRHWMKTQGFGCVPEHRTYFKESDCLQAWRKERDAAGIRDTTGRDSLWMYDAKDQPPWHQGYWVASVISENFPGATHAIVMRGSDVVLDPSSKPRRTPYKFVGEMVFVVPDPSKCFTSTISGTPRTAGLLEEV